MLDEMTIAEATGDHELEIIEVVRSAIRTSAVGLYSPAQLEAWAAGWGDGGIADALRRCDWYVAIVDDQVVGVSSLEGAELGQLFVRPDFGGLGIARALIARVEARARALSISTLTTVASHRSLPVFLKCGFIEREQALRDFNGQRYEVHLLEKLLE